MLREVTNMPKYISAVTSQGFVSLFGQPDWMSPNAPRPPASELLASGPPQINTSPLLHFSRKYALLSTMPGAGTQNLGLTPLWGPSDVLGFPVPIL